MKITARFEKVGPPASTARAPQPRDPAGPSCAAKNLALAHHLAGLIDRGLIADFTGAARLLGVSQPRLTHLMSLLLLAPTIQEAILAGTMAPGDKELRRLARVADWQSQLACWSR